MSHPEQREFVRLLSQNLPTHFNDVRVLEIGSLDINGSVRDFFRPAEYIGIDIGPGKGVDVVCEGQRYDAPDDSFDTVISCEAMEHNPHWVATFENMVRLCKPGGLVVMTCATTGRREHGTARTDASASPLTTAAGWNYYRNLRARDFIGRINVAGYFRSHFFDVNWTSYDLYFAGVKARGGDTGADSKAGDLEAARAGVAAYLQVQNGSRTCRYRSFVARAFGDWWFSGMRKVGDTLRHLHR